jgi:DNA-binding NarL/FixJ family response regulator
MRQKLSLLIISKHHLLTESLGEMLLKEGSFDVTGSATTLAEAEKQLASVMADVMLLDCCFPCHDVLRLIVQIRAERPIVKVIVLGVPNNEAAILQYVEAGTHGYLLENESFADLVRLMRSIMQGETACSPQIAFSTFYRIAELASQRREKQSLENMELSVRELQVLRLIAAGLSNREIAQQLFLSLHTVKNHVHSILSKLQAKHRDEAIEHFRDRTLMKLTTEELKTDQAAARSLLNPEVY